MANLNWWYNIVARRLNLDHARLVCANKAQQLKIQELEPTLMLQKLKIKKLENDIVRLESPSPVREWVEGAQVAAAKQRNRELEAQLTKMGLLRDALRNEKAYTLFLEDSLECNNPSEVFNALPLEKRQEYFNKAR